MKVKVKLTSHNPLRKCGGIKKKGLFETCRHNQLLTFSTNPYPVKNNNLINFMTVRHPYERLVSAYRDKVEHADKIQFYNKIGSFAKLKYRQIPPHLEANRELLAAASDKVIRSHGAPNPDNPFNNPLGPTFVEFSSARLLDRINDDHWASYETYCAPCAMNYNMIVKFETLHRDNMYIMERTGLEEGEWSGDRNPTLQGRTGEEIWRGYFSLLDRGLLELYQEMYSVDCELFSYDCHVSSFEGVQTNRSSLG